MTATVDPRRPDKVNRYKPVDSGNQGAGVGDDLMPDYMNILGKTQFLNRLQLKTHHCQIFFPQG